MKYIIKCKSQINRWNGYVTKCNVPRRNCNEFNTFFDLTEEKKYADRLDEEQKECIKERAKQFNVSIIIIPEKEESYD